MINTTTLLGQEIIVITKYTEVIWSNSLDRHTNLDLKTRHWLYFVVPECINTAVLILILILIYIQSKQGTLVNPPPS